jgi:hypothetical protein
MWLRHMTTGWPGIRLVPRQAITSSSIPNEPSLPRKAEPETPHNGNLSGRGKPTYLNHNHPDSRILTALLSYSLKFHVGMVDKFIKLSSPKPARS